MRRFAVALALLTGCASMGGISSRPATVFPPLPDEDTQATGAHDQGEVWVMEHRVAQHPDCYAVQRQNGAGIIRCGVGQLEWVLTPTVAEGVDDYDILKDAMRADAEKEGSALNDKEVDCTVGGAPASCRVFVFAPKDGTPARTTIIGLAQLPAKSLVAQCVAKAGMIDAMKPVCGEIFVLK